MGTRRILSNVPVESEKFTAEKHLEESVSSPLAHGLLMCITKRLAEIALPFPEARGYHDQWLMFCALCEDHCYYLNEQLVSYRLHGNNTSGKSKYASNRFQQILSIIRRFAHAKKHTDKVALGKDMMDHLKAYGLEDTPAYRTAKRVYEIGIKEDEAFNVSRIRGAYKLIHLYCTDMRFRRSGSKDFILKLFAILFK